MRNLSKHWTATVLLFVGLSGVAQAEVADTVLLGGHIWTGAGSEASALAVRDGKIVYVGADREARSYVGPKTQVISLKGRLDRKSTRLNSSHIPLSRMPSSA